MLLCGGLATVLAAQQFQINLDNLASKSSETVDVSLNGATLQFAAKFLNGRDPEEAKVQKLLNGIEGIYIRSYEFKQQGAWSAADLDRIRNQLRAPQWSRIVGVKGNDEISEVYVRTEGQKMTGLAILTAEATELTVVNIVGTLDINSLSELGGHFGIPKLDVPKGK
jgi:hypothetical protein